MSVSSIYHQKKCMGCLSFKSEHELREKGNVRRCEGRVVINVSAVQKQCWVAKLTSCGASTCTCSHTHAQQLYLAAYDVVQMLMFQRLILPLELSPNKEIHFVTQNVHRRASSVRKAVYLCWRYFFLTRNLSVCFLSVSRCDWSMFKYGH